MFLRRSLKSKSQPRASTLNTAVARPFSTRSPRAGRTSSTARLTTTRRMTPLTRGTLLAERAVPAVGQFWRLAGRTGHQRQVVLLLQLRTTLSHGNGQGFSTYPTADMRAGNSNSAFPTVYDPNSLTNGVRTPLPGNQIPASEMDPVAAKIQAFSPRQTFRGITTTSTTKPFRNLCLSRSSIEWTTTSRTRTA